MHTESHNTMRKSWFHEENIKNLNMCTTNKKTSKYMRTDKPTSIIVRDSIPLPIIGRKN